MNTAQKHVEAYGQGRLLCAAARREPAAIRSRPQDYGFVEGLSSCGQPAPLLCVLHGFGGADGGLIGHKMDWAIKHGAHIIVARSAGPTWDVLDQGYGPDVANIDAALHWALHAWSVDRRRIALAGFSDGASYALTIGLKNGGCFSHVMAFSPGFALTANPQGRPAICIAHGVNDETLPVACAQGIARRLHEDGYRTTYEEFDGNHVAPRDVVNRLLNTFREGAQ